MFGVGCEAFQVFLHEC